MSLNKCFMMGRLCKDPDYKTTQSGISLCNFSLALDRPVPKDAQKITDFADCTAWRGNADAVGKYLHKGDGVLIEGRYQTDKYVDKDGNNRNKTYIMVEHVEFLPGRRSDAGQQEAPAPQQEPAPVVQAAPGLTPVATTEDLPF